MFKHGGFSKEEYDRQEQESFYFAVACVAALMAFGAFVAMI